MIVFTALAWATTAAVRAATGIPLIDQNPNLSVSADLRLRYESDWDSDTATGVPRIDRERGRLRARLGFTYKLSKEWSVGARLRSGNHQSQQSPHLTFTANDGPSDDLGGSLDRYYVQYKSGAATVWGGRNNFPFWQQNEMVLDEDVTPTGVAATFDSKQGDGTLTSTVGAFALPDGATHLNGRFIGGQLKYTLPLKPAQLTVAAGLHSFDGESGARFLRNRNGERDYLIGVLSAQWSTPVGAVPLALGIDVIENFENYSAADATPLPSVNADETTGYVLSAQFGQLKNAKVWLLGYYYAHIETFAVNASFSQDDWARFGSGPQSDVTDIKGHEFRAAYAFTKNINVMARLFLVEAITTAQDGKRFRVDLNWKL
ncbi:MAG: putative porin [Opitutus sp.]